MSIKLKFVEPAVIPVTETDLVRKVELAYRICYKSEDKVNENSKQLVARLANNRAVNRHTSPLEHAWIKVTLTPVQMIYLEPFVETNRYLTIDNNSIIGNFRMFHDFLIDHTVEHDGKWHCGLSVVRELASALHGKYPEIFPKLTPGTTEWKISDDESGPVKRAFTYDLKVEEYPDYRTFRIVTTRDILQELVRHRTMSFSVESTRYCNYGKRGYQFVIPRPYEWANESDWDPTQVDGWYANHVMETKTVEITNQWGEGVGVRYVQLNVSELIERELPMYQLFIANCYNCAMRYDRAVNLGIAPQEARMLLPGGLKTELFMTGTNDQWQHFLKLRLDQHAHPQIRFLSEQIASYLK